MTGKIISEVGLETDLTNILEPETNDNSTNETIINQNNNATSVTETEQPEEDEEQTEILEISENKFIINSIDEDEIIKEIEKRTKLNKDEIKRAIKFKKKEPVKEDKEDEIEEEKTTTVVQQVQQLDYMTKVNGSIILRLG